MELKRKNDLIEALNRIEGNPIIVVASSNFEHSGANVPASCHIHEYKGEMKERSFRDAFDGQSYTMQVPVSSTDGKESFIKIS